MYSKSAAGEHLRQTATSPHRKGDRSRVQVISLNSRWKFKPAFEEREQCRPQEPAKVQLLVANSVIVLLFVQNISRALKKTKCTLLSSVTKRKVHNIQ